VPDTPEEPDDRPDLDAIADELYAVRPDEFVPERDEAVARAREAGDRELARAIGKLRRPTRAAWLANLLARERPDQLEGLLGLAAGLADAQRTLDGSALRALSSQRHRLVSAVAAEAGRLAAARHEPVGDGLLREVQGILEAALADPVIADEVRSGRLTRTVSYSGFGPAAEPGAVPAPPRRESRPAPEPSAPAAPAAQPDADDAAAREQAERERRERERARREQALAEAESAEAAALDRQHADEAARDDAAEAREAAKNRVAELAAELEAARNHERDATAALREAEVTAKASARAAGQAATATARARARLDELDA
jgi:hypothetical protein